MNFIELGKTGEKIPVLGMGTWQIEFKPEEAIKALKSGFEQGMKLVDTAEIYNNEEILGRAIKGEADIFVATKVSPNNFHYEDVIRACNNSLLKLGIKRIDLYQLHRSSAKIPIKETMEAMEELVRQGKIRYIGLSNFSIKEIEETQSIMKENEIVSNQIEYSILVRDAERGMLKFCKEQRITVLAYRPLVRGDLVNGRYQKIYQFLDGMSKKYNKTAAQVALNWVISKRNICAIPKSSNEAHVLENAGACSFNMSKEDIEILDGKKTSKKAIAKKKPSEIEVLYNTFIDQQFEWLCQDLKPLTTAIDIGANIGEATIYLAMHKEIIKILAYEPSPDLYAHAVANVKRSGLEHKIKLVNSEIGPLENILKGLKNVIIKSDTAYAKIEDTTDLSEVYRLQIKYHEGVQRLEKILEKKGFGVKTKRTEIEVVGDCGFVYARKW